MPKLPLPLYMTDPKAIWVLLLLFSYPMGGNLQAQFVNFELEIEPELSASVKSNLQFGQVLVNSGTQQVNLGDVNMGVFTISSLKSQLVTINLDFPRELTLAGGASGNNVIPIFLEASYNNRGSDNYQTSIPVEGSSARFKILEDAIANDANTQFWETAYIYIFGSITVGDIADGNYSGSILLTVFYE